MTAVKIPGYTLKKKLGQGGMAAVFLAVQESFGREVALKVMFPGIAKEPGFAERFLAEARTVAKLAHPHIIVVYDVGLANGLHYFAMEYHTGGDLTQRIRKRDVAVKEALLITRQIADALAFAHERQVIHRDIKPDNVLFRAHDGAAILTDFGIAKDLGDDMQLTQLGTTVGTPKYMSPEQARGHALDGRADLYSLGVMLFEMLTGQPPYMANDAMALGLKHCNDPIPRLPAEFAKLQGLIERLMAKQRTDRFADARQLMKEIDLLLHGDVLAPPLRSPAAGNSKPVPNPATAATVVSRVQPGKSAATPVPAAPAGALHFHTEETLAGGFFSKKSTLRAEFSCDDYDALKRQVAKLQDALKEWLASRGKKAALLQLEVCAHPWIHGRVRELFTRARQETTPLATVLGQAEVVLHLFDDQDPVGRTIQLSDKDGKPAPAPTSAG